jgi:hypothetical protein
LSASQPVADIEKIVLNAKPSGGEADKLPPNGGPFTPTITSAKAHFDVPVTQVVSRKM